MFNNLLELAQTLNLIENRLLTIEKQNANQSTKTETYASVIKAITKMTTIENKSESIIKKSTTADIIATKKEKKVDHKNRERSEKKEITKSIQYEISKKNQKNHRKRKK